jgi:hypothetical protein
LLAAAAPRAPQQTGSIAGTATSQTGDVLPNITVQLRDLSTGQIVGTQTSSEAGAYTFANLGAGNYAAEALNAAGQVIGTSASISLTAGQSLTGVVLQANAGLLTPEGEKRRGAGAGLASAVIIAVAAGTAFIGAKTNTSNTSSPSR